MKNIKTLLKETREAIEMKDFQLALKLSKAILKEDKTNYMGLIFLGFSLQEVGPFENTPKAFQKAIDIAPSNPLAWQGLINYYEKLNTNDSKLELIKLCISYLGLENDESRLVKYSKKLYDIRNQGDIHTICSALYESSKKCKDINNRMEILKLIVNILEMETDVSLNILDLYENCLENLPSSLVNEKFYSNYLILLNKAAQPIKMLDRCIQMNKLFPSNLLALSWVCKVFNQLYIEENTQIKSYEDCVQGYMQTLLQIDSKNAMGSFTYAIFLLEDGKLLETKQILEDVTSQRPGLLYAWVLLTDCLIQLKLFEPSLISLEKVKNLLNSTEVAPAFLKQKVLLQEVQILAMSTNPNDWIVGIEIYSRQDFPKDKCLFSIISININLDRYSEAEKHIFNLESVNKSDALMCRVKMLNKQQKYSEAKKLIESVNYESADWWIEAGFIYTNLQETKIALESFLKAAKCDPNNYLCFIHLGNYYNTLNQTDKARRCFERAFKINPKSSQAGCELSKIYRKQKNWDGNLHLLTSLTQESINSKNLWAWMQLGLTYLEQGDPSSSIDYFRSVLRVAPENVHCWESLADGYFARGAFTSALKCYEEASELSDSSLYSALQVGYIKKILGDYSEAKTDFENILRANGQYIPALKGLAETSFCQAKECFREQRLGTARDYTQLAVNKITLAVLQRSELSCLWKLLADCVIFVNRLPEKYSFLSLSKNLVGSGSLEIGSFFEKDDLFTFATRFYCKAVSLAEDSSFLWHDLAACYLDHARHVDDADEKEKLTQYALQAAQKSTSLNPSISEHWNLMGVVAFYCDSPNYALAQHSFIKAVIADRNSAVAWANLGTLYLIMGDIKLANQAFGEGQRADPNYVNSWIGQAIIAESLKHRDAMGLFRHSTQLGHHQQGGIGYAHLVCHALVNWPTNDKTLQYSIYNMHAIPVACDAIKWYTEKDPYNGCAWNMLGILCERMGLKSSARDAFANAFRYCAQNNRDKARVNFGRLLYQTGNFNKSIQMFADVEEATFSSGSGLALALYGDRQYEESYTAYEQALHWLTEETTSQSELLVALASMAYKFQGPEAAKTLLFQSIDLKPPSPWSLYSTLSLALLHNYKQLSKLVFKELIGLEEQMKQPGKEQLEYICHYSTLLSYFYILYDDSKSAISELSKLVHKYPNEASTWMTLSQVLFRSEKNKKRLEAAAKCTQFGIKLGRMDADVSKGLYLAALSFCIAGDLKQALLFAQKAVYYRPDSSEAWAMLVSLLTSNSKKTDLPKQFYTRLREYFINSRCDRVVLRWYDNEISKLQLVTLI